MAEKNKRKKNRTGILSVLLFLLTLLVIFGTSILKELGQAVIIRNVVMGGLGIGIVLFLMAQARVIHTYEYDNEEHTGRFFVWYMLALLMSAACAYLPSAGWPFLAVFVGLSLFSNSLIGIMTGTFLLSVTVMLTDSSVSIFLLYLVCGTAGVCLFRLLDESYKIGVPLMMSVLVLIICETASLVLFTNETLSIELFLIPFMNVIVSIILLLIVLRVFSVVVIYRYRDKYMLLNDQECPLLTELKAFSREEYYKAVHTAYFCGRIAAKLALDTEAAKAAGYYHHIGRMRGEDTWACVGQICEEYDFPPAARSIIQECKGAKKEVTAKEAAVVLMSDAVISAVLYLLSKDGDKEIEYDQVIDTVFKKKMSQGMLNDCQITMQEMTCMKKIFKEEELYYDFLR